MLELYQYNKAMGKREAPFPHYFDEKLDQPMGT